MDTLGAWLRRTREGKAVTLEEAEAATRIKVRFLEALEACDFAEFAGGAVQIRGFLRNYARYLGLSPDEVIARYDTDVVGIEDASIGVPAEAQPPASPPAGRSSVEVLMIAGIVLVVVIVLSVVVGLLLSRQRASGQAERVPTVTAAVSTQAAVPASVEPAADSPVATPAFAANADGTVTLALQATEHAWVRVTVDGSTAFEDMLAPGQVESWIGQETVIAETGNGAGVQATVNDQPQGALGGRAEVCARAWEPAGEIPVP